MEQLALGVLIDEHLTNYKTVFDIFFQVLLESRHKIFSLFR